VEDREQGGLTGATGSLTPSDPDDEFVPAETREISDPDPARRITAETPPAPNSGSVLGGDVQGDPEDEHL
jgi:hypothetical protein